MQPNGNGNQSCYLAGIGNKLGGLLLSLANRVNPDFVDDIEQHQAKLDGDAIEADIKASTLEVTEKQLLSPHIDKLFDRGWITFTDAGDLLCTEPSIEQALLQWGVELPLNVGQFNTEQATFLEYHRDEIFRAGPTLSA